jgi:WD40 repeat protein
VPGVFGTVGDDGRACIWNLTTTTTTSNEWTLDRARVVIQKPSARFSLLSFHPRADNVLTTTDARGVDLWDVTAAGGAERTSERARIHLPHPDAIYNLACSSTDRS